MDGIDELDIPEEHREMSVDYAAKKRRIVLLLLGGSAIFGVIACFLPEEDTALDFIVGLTILILMISWCFTDAAERHHRIGLVMRLLLVLVFIVGFPIYLLQTRGFSGFKTLGLSLLLVAAMFACIFTASLITLFIIDVTGLWDVDWTA